MERSKIYILIVVVLLFGVCLGVPLGGGSSFVVGINHWTHDEGNNFLVPTNTSVNVSLNNNSLLYANLSVFAGDNLTWDDIDQQFDLLGSGTSKWNRAGTTLYTKVNGDDVQINGSLTLGSFLDMDFNDINNVNDLHVDNDVDVGNDLHVNDRIEHLGDSDTYFDFNGNQILFFAGGIEYLDMSSNVATFGVNVTMNRNLTVTDTVTANYFVGDGSGLTNINASNITGGLWNRSGTTLYTATDGDAVQLNSTLYTKGNISMEGNRTINATKNLTVGNAGDVLFGDDVLRDMYPFVDLMMNLGTPTNRFNYVYGLSLFGDGGNLTNISFWNRAGTTLYTATDNDVVQLNSSLGVGGASGSTATLINTDITPLTAIAVQNGISMSGTSNENSGFQALNIVPNFSPTGDNRLFKGINLGAVLQGSKNITSANCFEAPLLSLAYTGKVTDVHGLLFSPSWVSGNIANIYGAKYAPAKYGGIWNNQVGFQTKILDEAENNTHILLADTQPEGDYAIYSDSTYPSVLSGKLNATAVNVTDGDLNVSDGNVYIHGTDNNAIYPYSLNVWNLPGRAWSYIFIGNAEGGKDGGAFFGLEGAPGGDRFSLYNWQGGGIRFLTDLVATSGKTRLDILNNGNIHVYQNLSIGQASDSGGGLILKGRNLVGTTNDLGGHITWYHDTGIEGYTFVNNIKRLVFNDTAQNKVDDNGSAWIELDTGNASFAGNVSVTGNITGNVHHGEAYFHNHDGDTLTFVSDIWYNLTFNASKNLNGFTWDGLGNLTCLVSGLYDVGYTACGSGQNNHIYHLAVGVNGIVDVNVSAHKKMAAGADETDMGGSGFIQLTAGDYVSLMIRDHGGAGTGKYIHSNLNLVRIGD